MFRPFKNKYLATILAVGLAGTVALLPGPSGKMGTGGLILWPLFGAINQLLAGLTLLVIMFYLWRRNRPIWFIALPAVLLIVMPAWRCSGTCSTSSTAGWSKNGIFCSASLRSFSPCKSG